MPHSLDVSSFVLRETLQEHLTMTGHRNKKPDGTEAAQRVRGHSGNFATERGGRGGGYAVRGGGSVGGGRRQMHNPNVCRVCKEEFDTKDLLKFHLDESGHRGGSRPRDFVCFFCKEKFQSRAELQEHLTVRIEIRATQKSL